MTAPATFAPLKSPVETAPPIFRVVGFCATVANFTAIVDVLPVFHVRTSFPLALLGAPAPNVLQLPGLANFALNDAVAEVTPLPAQPPILTPDADTVETTFFLLPSF